MVSTQHVFLSVEIGGTKLQVSAGHGDGTIIQSQSIEVFPARNASEILEKLVPVIQKLHQQFSPTFIGVGYGGPVDRSTGKVICSHQVDGWDDFPLREHLEKITGIGCVVENDANVAALGEAVTGSGKPFRSVFYITLGSGVGAGFVQEKKLYHGNFPTETEFGHLRLDRSGTIVESRCAGWAIDKKIREAAMRSPGTRFGMRVSDWQKSRGMMRGEASLLLELVRDENEEAIAIWKDLVSDLGFALSQVTHILNPEVIILGGGLGKIGTALTEAVRLELRNWTMDVMNPLPEILPSSLEESVVPAGGLILAHRTFQKISSANG